MSVQHRNKHIHIVDGSGRGAYGLVWDLTGVGWERATAVQDKGGACLTEGGDILGGWSTECCSRLYGCRAVGDPDVLGVPPTASDAGHLILREEVEAAVKLLRKGKSAGVDNIPAELLWQGGEAMVGALLLVCSGVWRLGGGWPAPWTQSLVVALSGNGG